MNDRPFPVAHDPAFLFGCGRFRMEPHLLEHCAEEILRFGRHPLFVCDANSRGAGDDAPERVEACCTVQVKDYSRYAMDGLQPDAHLAWRDAHWESDLAAARAAGQAMGLKV